MSLSYSKQPVTTQLMIHFINQWSDTVKPEMYPPNRGLVKCREQISL